MMKTLIIVVAIVIVLIVGLGLFYWNRSSTDIVATSTASPSNVATDTPLDQFCYLTAHDQITAYTRPNKTSPVFGQINADEQITVGGTTSDGWIGFDPASAQAPNVGPFRLRWIEPDANYSLRGNCDNIPQMVSLPALACFTMAQTDIPIYTTKSATSAIIATMHFGDYTKVTGTTGTKSTSWVKVDLSVGTLNMAKTGWIGAGDVNYNGKDCSSLPTVL